jgi:ribosomal protein S18 acetylase RimI-like enzyme
MSPESIIDYLSQEAMRHITPIKLFSLYADQTTCAWFGKNLIATVAARESQYDRLTYPHATLVAYPALTADASDSEIRACAEYIASLTATEYVILKTLDERLIAEITRRTTCKPQRALATFLRTDIPISIPTFAKVHVEPELPRNAQTLVQAHGVYSEDEIKKLFEDGEGRCFWIESASNALAVALSYPTTKTIHEVGNVYVTHEARRQGYARAIVCAAIENLASRGKTARYVVDTKNTASIALATQCGLAEKFRLQHLQLF